VEVLRGPERRRRWPNERKIAIVAETLEPGIVVADVARRHDLSPSQLYGWLKQFRNEAQALIDAKRPMFAPAVLDTRPVATLPSPAPVL
jgi:transposase